MASRQSLGTKKTYIRAGIEAQDATSTTTGSRLVGSQNKKNLPHRLPVRGWSANQKLAISWLVKRRVGVEKVTELVLARATTTTL